MPLFDGTGPAGRGPKGGRVSGRRKGICRTGEPQRVSGRRKQRLKCKRRIGVLKRKT